MNPYSTETPEWCFVHPRTNEPSAPVLVRDLEVLWETGEINLQTLVWKQGMTEWKKIVDIPDLHRKILDDTYVPINPINKPLLQTVTKEDVRIPPQQPQKVGNILGTAAKKDDPEEELDSLEKKFEKLKQNFYQSSDGLYHVMDPVTKQWKTQAEAPNIEVLDEETLENLIFGINNEDGEDGEKKNKNKGKNKNAKAQMVDLDTLTDEQIKKMERNKRKAKKQAEKKRQKWYEAKVNNCLYVKGLPDDITHEELKTFFSKAGVIRLDLEKGSEKIKIYTDEKGRPKGDALISYVRPESVDLAMEMLHDTEIRPKYRVILDKAQFEQKGDYVPRKKVTEDKVALIKTKTDQDRLLSWNEEEEGEGLKIVIILNMFGPEDVEAEENFEENLRQDIIEECEAKLGQVQRVTVYENNPEGAVQIKFKEDAAAEKCIQLMNGRYFAGRELRCFYWDGKTDYRRTRETLEDEQRRLDEFGKWIEGENEPQGE